MVNYKKKIWKILLLLIFSWIGYAFFSLIQSHFLVSSLENEKNNYIVVIPDSSSGERFNEKPLIIIYPDSSDALEKNIYYYSQKDECIKQQVFNIPLTKNFWEELFVQWKACSELQEDFFLTLPTIQFGYEDMKNSENSTIQVFRPDCTVSINVNQEFYLSLESNKLVLDSLIRTIMEAYDVENLALTIFVDGEMIYDRIDYQ